MIDEAKYQEECLALRREMEHPEQQYLNLLREVKTHGSTKEVERC